MLSAIFKLFACLFLLINVADAHGRLLIPENRGEYCSLPSGKTFLCYDRNYQYCDWITIQYYGRGGTCHVCGNNNYDWLAADQRWKMTKETKFTGPIKATYKSGEQIRLTAHIITHKGFMRVKLCKLNSPNDVVSQECLNENLLEILADVPANYSSMYFLDKYTIYTAPSEISVIEQGYYKLDFFAKLPDGLSCENCVLLWEWETFDQIALCFDEQGARVSNKYSPELFGSPCLNQYFRSCSDIKIEPVDDASEYKPNRFPKVKNPALFSCAVHHNERGGTVKDYPVPNLNDKNGADGMLCLIAEEDFEMAGFNHTYLQREFCQKCFKNCYLPGKTCPSDCYCRWYRKPENL